MSAIDVEDLLRNRVVVMVGGDLRHAAKESIEHKLGLSEMVWFPTKHHKALGNIEAHIKRPEVAVVLLAIRWSTHSFASIAAICRKYDKPLVRLPGGYNPNQVASQIMSQCHSRLRTTSADTQAT